jgi:hypothetical protein
MQLSHLTALASPLDHPTCKWLLPEEFAINHYVGTLYVMVEELQSMVNKELFQMLSLYFIFSLIKLIFSLYLFKIFGVFFFSFFSLIYGDGDWLILFTR